MADEIVTKDEKWVPPLAHDSKYSEEWKQEVRMLGAARGGRKRKYLAFTDGIELPESLQDLEDVRLALEANWKALLRMDASVATANSITRVLGQMVGVLGEYEDRVVFAKKLNDLADELGVEVEE